MANDDEKRAGPRRSPALRTIDDGWWRSPDEIDGCGRPGTSASEIDEAEAARLGQSDFNRRDFLKLLGASLAIAGLPGCEHGPPEELLPYTVPPPGLTPGIPLHYATASVIDGYATGLVATSHDGRPTKLEGNPGHPASLGAGSPFEQAAVWTLYDPRRAQSLLFRGQPSTWDLLRARLLRPRTDHGRGLRFLLEPQSSPLLAAQLAKIIAIYPEARFVFHSPLASGNALSGARAAFGQPALLQYHFDRADVIFSFSSDFLGLMPFSLRHSRDWARRRRVSNPHDAMNRLYMAETRLSVTGSMADERLPLRPSLLVALAAVCADEIRKAAQHVDAGLGAAIATLRRHAEASLSREQLLFAKKAAADLMKHAGAGLVLVGERQPAAVHVLAHAMNDALGNVEKTVGAVAPVRLGESGEPFAESFAELCGELRAGKVKTLWVLGGNPSYAAPADYDFSRLLRAVPESVHLGLYQNETSDDCAWFVPAAHWLESWELARAYDGTLSIVQPLIEPLHNGKSIAQIFAMCAGESDLEPYRLVRDQFESAFPQAKWDDAVQRGFVPNTAAPTLNLELQPAPMVDALDAASSDREDRPNTKAPNSYEIDFVPDYKVLDGRFAENGWLQELPEPVTKLAWDNAALIGHGAARSLGVTKGDLVEIQLGERTLQIAVLPVAGHAEGAITIPLGYGRRAIENASADNLAGGVGFNAYVLRTSDHLHHASGALVKPLRAYLIPGITSLSRNRGYPLAQTQRHFSMEGRPIAIATTLDEYRRNPGFTAEHKGPVPSLMPPRPERGPQWAMSIDLTVCTGCSSCVAACFAENNLMMVGKRGVLHAREMHWIRIDTYFAGSPEKPRVVHQPMLCQHCEKAPCEYVCPVNATVHSEQGLNEMVYNRCVGTRFCSNNCPYKVRRFNWFNWRRQFSANVGPVALQRNPEVTVRDRGVMEKCSYCVQRIRAAEIRADIEQRELKPGEFQTACQQACPTRAIEFGALQWKASPMVRYRDEPRSYAVLHDQGTQPRTMYLARVENPNPIEYTAAEDSKDHNP